jgi:hypothetical protein
MCSQKYWPSLRARKATNAAAHRRPAMSVKRDLVQK